MQNNQPQSGAFYNAIRGKEKISIIAEIKRASPSFGKFPERSVKNLVKAYERAGASALSVVTEATRFNGSIDLLKEMRSYTKLPILRKDFIKTIPQIDETVQAGANAILLIAHILTQAQINILANYAIDHGLDVLMEIHDEKDLAKTCKLCGKIIGINNRNLETLETDVTHANKLIPKIDPTSLIVVESGFKTPKDLKQYYGKIDAVLIGTALLASESPFETLTKFTHVSRT